MGKRMKDYVAAMLKLANELAAGNGSLPKNKEAVLQELLVQIGFFQHERLIHLIVTVLFALLTVFTVTAACFVNNSYYGLLFCLLTITCILLLVPYIRHYYILENGVQKLYEIYDAIRDGRAVAGYQEKDKK